MDGVSPSFVEELIFVIEESVSDSGLDDASFVLTNVPTRLSSKFQAIGRGRQVDIVESAPGTWRISGVAPARQR